MPGARTCLHAHPHLQRGRHGIVPPYPLGRVYRDCLGRVNARLAAEADTVLLMVAGLPIEIKALADAWRREAARRFGTQG